MSNSPTSSSIPPSSKLSLSQLPVELLRQIVESSVPSYYHSSTYSQQQLTLRKICLTSRLFREIAQPVLERFDHLRLPHEDDGVEQAASARASGSNVLSINIAVEMPLERMNTLLLAYARLKELHIDATHDTVQVIDVSLLAALPCLESLTMHKTRLTVVTTHPLLTLKSLTLSRCYGDVDALFEQPSFLPSLKVLALPDDHDIYDGPYNHELLSRLELFIGNPDSFREEAVKEHSDKFLSAYRYDRCELTSLRQFKTRHCSLRVSSVDLETADDVEDLYEALNEIRALLDASGPPLKTLFLDKGLRDALFPYRSTQVTYDGLIKTCEERGIEVILEEQGVLNSADSAITPELLRWMDRRKEKAKLSLDAEAKMETR